MEKNLIIFKIVLLIAIIIILGNLLWFLVFKNTAEYVKPDSSSIIKSEKKQITNIKKIDISHINADIEVYQSNSEEVEIIQYVRNKINKNHIFTTSISGDTLSIHLEKNDISLFFFNIPYGKTTIKVYIPKTYKGDVFAKTVSGDIKVDNFELKSLELSSTSGEINFGSIISDTVIKTVSGDIEGNTINGISEINSTSGDIEVNEITKGSKLKTVSGSISVEKINGDTNIRTTSGSIEIDDFLITGNSKLQTVSGKIELFLNSKSNVVIKTSTVSGKVTYPDGLNSMGTEPFNTLEIKTTSGNIKALKRN